MGLCSLGSVHSRFLRVFSWLAHFFLALNDIPFSRGTTVYLSIYLLKDILVAQVVECDEVKIQGLKKLCSLVFLTLPHYCDSMHMCLSALKLKER